MPALVVSAPSESRRLMRRRRWNLFRGIMALLTVMAIGVVGFKVIEGDDWTWMDAAYMSVITMSTVGFEEVRPLSELGRVFSIVIIITGVGAFAYTFATLGEQLISGQLVSNLRQRGAEAMMRRLRGHHIVVGYGDTGTIVAAELNGLSGARVVVIDNNGDAVRNASEDGYIGIHGDGGQDEVLMKAGIERASSLICTVSSDSAALMTVLTAHVMAPDVEIVAKATLPESEPKLLRAGASSVVSMHHIAARSIVEEILDRDAPMEVGNAAIEVEGEQSAVPDGITSELESGGLPNVTGEVINVEGIKWVRVQFNDFDKVSHGNFVISAIRRAKTGELVKTSSLQEAREGDELILIDRNENIDSAFETLSASQP